MIAPHQGPAIHIIMERGTGKTSCCFVEFESPLEAMLAFNRFTDAKNRGNPRRIRERNVIMEPSSQEELMKAMFPRARCVVWRGQCPELRGPANQYESGFKAFLTSEEIVMTVKLAESPQRVSRSLPRPIIYTESYLMTWNADSSLS